MRLPIFFLCLAFLLTGCPSEAPPTAAEVLTVPASAANDQGALMGLVFGKAYRPAKKNALAELPMADEKGKTMYFLLEPRGVKVLDNGLVVLVVNGLPSDEAGAEHGYHVSPGTLSVYVLENVNGMLQVKRRHESIDTLGSFGSIGDVTWVQLADGKPGLAIVSGGTWQGYSIGVLALYDVLADKLHDLAGSINLFSTNDGGCGPTTAVCWDIQGGISLVAAKGKPYNDLVITFNGYRDTQEVVEGEASEESEFDSEAEGDARSNAAAKPAEEEDGELTGPARKHTELRGRARYAYTGKQYKLVEGENIVPNI